MNMAFHLNLEWVVERPKTPMTILFTLGIKCSEYSDIPNVAVLLNEGSGIPTTQPWSPSSNNSNAFDDGVDSVGSVCTLVLTAEVRRACWVCMYVRIRLPVYNYPQCGNLVCSREALKEGR